MTGGWWRTWCRTWKPPRTPTEELLAAIWAEVLGVDRVGAADDFFALGGHSLLATRAVSRIESWSGVALPLRTVFESPTAAGLAAEVASALTAASGARPPLVPRPAGGAPAPAARGGRPCR